jgi:hypothetical protein
MASNRLIIHIRPDAEPTNIAALLRHMDRHRDQQIETIADLIGFSFEIGIKRDEGESIAAMMQLLGLIMRDELGVHITNLGDSFLQIREDAQNDVLHFLFYILWSVNEPATAVKSWSYRYNVDRYWNVQTATLDADNVARRVEEARTDAEAAFAEMGLEEVDPTSFGPKSLTAIHKWLHALNPPVIENNIFTRRSFCPPELLLLALGWVVGREGLPDTDVLLSREARDAVCRVCLLEPTAFDRALDWMIPIFPDVIAPGTTAGFYGRFVRFHKLPELADTIR